MDKNNYELIITIVDRGFSDNVVEATREAGASGGTIIYGRGSSTKENGTSIFGINILPEKEVVMTLAHSDKKADIMRAICEKSNLNTEGKGISFSLPINKVVGIAHINKQIDDKNKKD